MKKDECFGDILNSFKTIFFDNNQLCDNFFINLEQIFEKISQRQELSCSPETLTTAIYELIMNKFLDIFLLMESMEVDHDENDYFEDLQDSD